MLHFLRHRLLHWLGCLYNLHRDCGPWISLQEPLRVHHDQVCSRDHHHQHQQGRNRDKHRLRHLEEHQQISHSNNLLHHRDQQGPQASLHNCQGLRWLVRYVYDLVSIAESSERAYGGTTESQGGVVVMCFLCYSHSFRVGVGVCNSTTHLHTT